MQFKQLMSFNIQRLNTQLTPYYLVCKCKSWKNTQKWHKITTFKVKIAKIVLKVSEGQKICVE